MNSSSHQHSWGSQAFTRQRSHPPWEESQPSHSALSYASLERSQDGPLTHSNESMLMYFVFVAPVECWNFFGNLDFHKTLSWVGNSLSQCFAYVSERQPREARSSSAYFRAAIEDRPPTTGCRGGQNSSQVLHSSVSHSCHRNTSFCGWVPNFVNTRDKNKGYLMPP